MLFRSGARGANSGLQDADNLAWKLKLVLDGLAPDSLMDSYSDERVAAADENLLNSTRSTDFITPKSAVSREFRNAVLTLAGQHAFARTLVNSGRLSVPAHLTASTLNTPDAADFSCVMQPGAPVADAPVRQRVAAAGGLGGVGGVGSVGSVVDLGGVAVETDSETDGWTDGWLLRHTGGRFVLLLFADSPDALDDQPARAAVTGRRPHPGADRVDHVAGRHRASWHRANRHHANRHPANRHPANRHLADRHHANRRRAGWLHAAGRSSGRRRPPL